MMSVVKVTLGLWYCIKLSVEQWCNDTDREKPKYINKNNLEFWWKWRNLYEAVEEWYWQGKRVLVGDT